MLYLAVGAVILVVLGYLLLRNKVSIFSNDEKLIVAKLAYEEAAVLADFKKGKEDVIAEYERLKARVTNLVSLKSKLPAVGEVISSPVVAPTAPVVAAVVQPVVVAVTSTPVVEPQPVVVVPDPNQAQSL